MFTDVHQITHQELHKVMIENVLHLEGKQFLSKKNGKLMANKSRKFSVMESPLMITAQNAINQTQ